MKTSNNGKTGTTSPARVDELPEPTTLLEAAAAIHREEAELREGGGPAGHARQRKLGRLPVRERLALLLDKGAPFLELNLWAAWRMYPDVGAVPAAGVVTGVGVIEGRR